MAINFSNSVSGLQAQSKRLAVSANNVANVSTAGTPGVTEGENAVYKPQEVIQTTTAGGGVRAETRPVQPASVSAYAPQNPLANDEGVVDLPNVSLEAEFTDQLLAKRAYQANASVIKTQDEMLSSLMDIKS
ncbi:flagellar basal body rod protein FlgC [Denitrobaculum tricleocarpae]|uniref:Flagellar biosynthesis protein FlgG n=1 Tax=Denitrobaculum tricleocarpae TaxID=2591009 RepID=A0A545T204_9PROT|nr:flagellar basal body rod C-terminal domain-containing protein [Denitrobaculum tricleocarpae]TQV71233.1 flagellar biosynthesis protein FlgG [Denitrobaculum tricleocarpae]